MSAPQWKVRAAQAADIHFLYSTWLNSYRSGSLIGRSTKKSVFFDEYYGVLDHLFSLSTTRTLVACAPFDEFVIIGFLVCGPEVLHYCYTKKDFWRLGVARTLFAAAFPGVRGISYTHKTQLGDAALSGRADFTYNPFLLFQRLPTEKESNEGKNEQKREQNAGMRD